MGKRIFVCLILLMTYISCDSSLEEHIEATGTIEAIQVRVSSKVSANAEESRFDEGMRVQRGDTLVILDRSTLDIQLRHARAGVDLAAAQLELMMKGARDEDIRAAEAALRQAEASMQVAHEDFRRMQNLYEADGISRRQFEEAEMRLTIAVAQYNAARENLSKLQRLSRPEEIKAQEARLRQAEAAAELLERQIRDCYIVSPVDGIITSKLVELGELVRQGAPVAVISKLDTVRLMIYLSTIEVGQVKLGGNVGVTIDAFPEKQFAGRITYISPTAEFTPRNIQTKDERVKQVFGVRVEIPNPEGILKPGLPADARVRIDK